MKICCELRQYQHLEHTESFVYWWELWYLPFKKYIAGYNLYQQRLNPFTVALWKNKAGEKCEQQPTLRPHFPLRGCNSCSCSALSVTAALWPTHCSGFRASVCWCKCSTVSATFPNLFKHSTIRRHYRLSSSGDFTFMLFMLPERSDFPNLCSFISQLCPWEVWWCGDLSACGISGALSYPSNLWYEFLCAWDPVWFFNAPRLPVVYCCATIFLCVLCPTVL